MSLRERLGEWFAPAHPSRRALIAFLVCFFSAALLTDWRANVAEGLAQGSVATDDVISPVSFTFVDQSATEQRQSAAELAVPLVFDVDPGVVSDIKESVGQAYDMARRRVEAARALQPSGSQRDLPADVVLQIAQDFAASLGVVIDPEVLAVLVAEGFSPGSQAVVEELVDVGMRRQVIRDRSELPPAGETIRVILIADGARQESAMADFSVVRTPEEARQSVSIHLVERFAGSTDPTHIQAAATVARAMVRPNFSFNQLITSERKRAAREAVGLVEMQVRRGARIIQAGDVVDARQEAMLDVLRAADGRASGWWRFAVWFAFCAVVILAPVAFARQTIRKFAARPGEMEAIGLVLVFVLGLGRLAVSSVRFVQLPGQDDAGALGLLVPVAGGAMLVRILVNSESALIFALVASLLAGALMDQSALFAAWYLVTAVVAAGLVGQARERLNVLRAGFMSGVVGAGLVLILTLLRSQGTTGAVAGLDWSSAAFSAITAFAAGIMSAMMALGLVPAMEALGFLTDYKLFELANLNHPLLRRLMLQAPGTYHHSVIVGSLSEAACEAIGANALLARVACYFHDVGKGLKPQYFVENQRDGGNRHDRLSPEQSAQVIIAHVREGGVLAKQYDLPRPIYDNIFMHHGTGLIPYFYNRAKEQSNGQVVEEALFRYPGPKPNTREAGIIMLADKIEAACRTIKEPTEERIRAMIQAIVNSVMSDGQLEECPITLKELYRIADAFVAVLLGIYHHRIEYPTTKNISSGAGKYVPVPTQGTITLEIINPLRSGIPSDVLMPSPGLMPDYESVEAEIPPRTPPTDDA